MKQHKVDQHERASVHFHISLKLVISIMWIMKLCRSVPESEANYTVYLSVVRRGMEGPESVLDMTSNIRRNLHFYSPVAHTFPDNDFPFLSRGRTKLTADAHSRPPDAMP